MTREQALAAPLRSTPRPSLLATPLDLSARIRPAAEALGLVTVGDLLEHFPHTHRDRRETRPASAVGVGEEATLAAVVRSVEVRPRRGGRRGRVAARMADESGPLLAVWWGQPWVARQLAPGAAVRLHGRMKRRNEFWVSEHELAAGAGAGPEALGLVPVYPAAQGLPPERLRSLALAHRGSARHTIEPLPAAVRVGERLAERQAALAAAHFPESGEDRDGARRRLAFEELLLLELALGARKRASGERRRARALAASGELADPWRADLPFTLTGDQRAALERIDRDLALEHPMQRLLMGEVGSGKTVVAVHAMLRALESGRQAALMAPTETLAEQHLLTLDRLLGGLVPLALLTGSTAAAARRPVLERLASGELGLVVGTHALLEPAVAFRDLAVVVIDEQHRFGVRQRAALDAKAPDGLAPHALHMTATPIPRTLALTAYGDLDATVLRELPAGRRPVETHVVDGLRARARAYERIREEIAAGRQCFVVCPLVEESEALQARAATSEAERLSAGELAGHTLRLIHGQMPAHEKAAAMSAFVSGAADVLVATSVVEVGIDVPNASVMLIEAAERYGLSQLHQLRGRVGRGEHRSLCILFGDPGLPRLRAIAEHSDGFRLAEIDLELRGAGEVLGTRQHGLPQFKVARLPDDAPLLERAREIAERLLAADPELERAEHALLRAAAAERFGSQLEPIPA